MLRPLPGRFKTFTSDRERQRHPFFRHPPAIVRLLSDALGLGEMKASGHQVQTVWSSATLNSVVRGFVQRSRWIRKEEHVVIDTSGTPESASSLSAAESPKSEGVPSSKTVHFCLSVDPLTGNMRNLGSVSADATVSEYVEPDPNDPAFKERIHPLMVENLALLHATRNADGKGNALAIVPDGTPVSKLQDTLAALGTSSMIVDGTDEPEEGALLLVTRSHVRGLDIPNIATVYLLNGLDVTSMSKASRGAGGMEERKREYTHFAGRMKRLGASKGEPATYAMVNLVMQGSAEEGALRGMLVDKPELEVRSFEGTGIDT